MHCYICAVDVPPRNRGLLPRSDIAGVFIQLADDVQGFVAELSFSSDGTVACSCRGLLP